MEYVLTQHAQDRLANRQIALEWIERTLARPVMMEADRTDSQLRHYLAPIPEYGNRVLQVIINPATTPVKIVTFYFDHNLRGKL